MPHNVTRYLCTMASPNFVKRFCLQCHRRHIYKPVLSCPKPYSPNPSPQPTQPTSTLVNQQLPNPPQALDELSIPTHNYINMSSGFNNLPDEVLLDIAQRLRETRSAVSYSNCLSNFSTPKYQEILKFCKINRQCGRVGQEVIFNHCHITERKLSQFFRTLLSPNTEILRAKVRSLTIKRSLRKDIIAPLVPEMIKVVQESSLPGTVKDSWITAIKASTGFEFYLVIIIFLLPNLRHLDIQGLNTKSMLNLVQGIKEMQASGTLQALNSITIHSLFDIKSLLGLPTAFESSPLKKLEVFPINREIILHTSFNLVPHDAHNQPEMDKQSAIKTISLGPQFPEHLLGTFLSQFRCLRSLTFKFDILQFGNSYRVFWDHLTRVKDSLEHLHISHSRDRNRMREEPNFPLWPRNLDQMHKLKVLEWEGGLEPQWRHLSDSYTAAAFFPPNIEEFRFIPDRIVTGDVQYVYDATRGNRNGSRLAVAPYLRDFLENVDTCRPSLKTITVSLSLWKPHTFYELQLLLKKKGVQLLHRDTQEERKELWTALAFQGRYFGEVTMSVRQLEEMDKQREKVLAKL